MNAFAAELGRECRLALRRGALALGAVAFFALAVVLFGLAADGGGSYARGAVWVLALFAGALAADALFVRDQEDGTLEQLLLHARPLFLAVLGKLLAHWLVSAAPLLALCPVALLVLQGSLAGSGPLLLALGLGTPTLVCLGGIGAALTVGTGRHGLLLALLVLPLAIPVLVFGVAASGGAEQAPFALLMLAALLTGAVTAAPFAIAKALAIGQEY